MPRPAPSCAPAVRRTPTAPRSTPPRGGARCRSAIADAGGLDDVAAWAIGGQQHGMVVLDAEGRVIRPALLWNDTRSAEAARRPDRRVRRRRRSRSAPGSCRWHPSRSPSCAGCATTSPTNAARVAAVALPHDWLTWRLRGFGPVGESPRGPVLDELVTDRSDASRHRLLGARDRRLRPRAARRGARARRVLPRVLGPGEWAGRRRPAAPRRRRRGRQRRRGARARRAAGRRRRLDRHERHGLRGERGAHDRPASGTVAGFADATGPLPAARRDAQRRARARRHRAAARRRPRRAQPARARGRARRSRRSRSCRTSRASARRTCPTPRRPSPA